MPGPKRTREERAPDRDADEEAPSRLQDPFHVRWDILPPFAPSWM